MRICPFVAGAVVAMIAATASAGTIDYSYEPNPDDLDDLTHQYAYNWTFDLGLGPGETIISAELILHGIRDWQDESNVLYIHLIDPAPGAPLGVTSYWDNENPSDYFLGQGIELITYYDLGTSPVTKTHPFTAPQLTTLNTYAADDVIELAFDPDCHFYNCGVELKLTTVPEPATAGLLILAGVPAMIGRRRR